MVHRCVCHDVPFTQIDELARAGMSFEQIRDRTKCSTGCGMCEQYCKVVVSTGIVSLPVMSQEQADRLIRQAEAWKKKKATA